MTAIFIPFLLMFTLRIFETEKSTESLRYKRRINMLEEKLRELEALKSADLETIIKSKDI